MARRVVKPVDAHVGRLVRHRRLEVGMSQENLEDILRWPFQQVERYENGTNRIGSSHLMQIASVLGVTPTYFFKGAPTAVTISGNQQNSMDHVAEFVKSEDGVALMRAFIKLPKEVQRSIVNLVDMVAENQ